MRIIGLSTSPLFAALCLAALNAPAEAHGDLIRLTPSSYRERNFVFDLKGVRGEAIQAGWLKPGGRRVDAGRISTAASRGVLRVRRAEFRPRPPRVLTQRRLSRYRLMLRRGTDPPKTPQDALLESPQEVQHPFFSPSSFWNTPLAPDAPLDPSSPALSAQLRDTALQQAATGPGPWISTYGGTTTLYTVPADQPTVRVNLDNGSVGWRPELQAAFAAVPIPPGARPATNADARMTIWQPSADKLWEFWLARKDALGIWHAGYGGAMRNVSQSPGYYTSHSWPGAPHAYGWGGTASGLPLIGGTILLDELRQGHIDHALAMNIPVARANVFSWPAQRTDGLDGPDAIPYGARFRLDPNLDIAALDLPPLVRMIAEAAQRYGIVVRDRTGANSLISFYVEDTSLLGAADPFWAGGRPRPDGYFQGLWPRRLMAQFPWGRLELLQMTLCNRSAPRCP
jgi:hypothetical protein